MVAAARTAIRVEPVWRDSLTHLTRHKPTDIFAAYRHLYNYYEQTFPPNQTNTQTGANNTAAATTTTTTTTASTTTNQSQSSGGSSGSGTGTCWSPRCIEDFVAVGPRTPLPITPLPLQPQTASTGTGAGAGMYGASTNVPRSPSLAAANGFGAGAGVMSQSRHPHQHIPPQSQASPPSLAGLSMASPPQLQPTTTTAGNANASQPHTYR